MDFGETIAALATAPFPAGVAIIRVSGSLSKQISLSIFSGKNKPSDHPRLLCTGTIIDPDSSEQVDSGMMVFMPGPKSYTGEDVLEIHLHGSPLIAQKVLRIIYNLGARAAEAGEFTKRAFLNSKLDLTQAESVADIINSKTEASLKIASEQLTGRLSSAINEIGEPLRDTLAELEAHIDFPEEDIDPKALHHLSAALEQAQLKIDKLIGTYQFGQLVKEGVRVLLCGRPNAGKSSLLNKFLGKSRAIVSDISGTTRDLIEEEAVIDGKRFIFCDSAGIRQSQDTIEKIGVELARSRIPWAEIVLMVVDSSDSEKEWIELAHELEQSTKHLWIVINKIDLQAGPKELEKKLPKAKIFKLSTLTGEGFDSLVNSLAAHVDNFAVDKSEAGEVITNERQRACLEQALKFAEAAKVGLDNKKPLEIISVDIRSALGRLEEIVGKTYTEDILGRIFGKFCIGK